MTTETPVLAGPRPGTTQAGVAREAHMRLLVDQITRLEERLKAGGGPERIAKQHKSGKLTARERLAVVSQKCVDSSFSSRVYSMPRDARKNGGNDRRRNE